MTSYTHLLADGFLPVFGRLNGECIGDDLPALGRAGIKVALLGHGSEIRDPGRHLATHEHSLFRDAPDGMIEALTAIASRNRHIAETSGLPVYVTTPDLLSDLPNATWAPLVINVSAWACDQPEHAATQTIMYLHAPSKRWTKGTNQILPTLAALHERGAIELRLAEGVPWNSMRQWVFDADIVVDQMGTGAYGTLAVEAMAAGKAVVAYLGDAFEALGFRPPIVNATLKTLQDTIERLIEERETTIHIGVESVDFVRAYHDGRRTASALRAFTRS